MCKDAKKIPSQNDYLYASLLTEKIKPYYYKSSPLQTPAGSYDYSQYANISNYTLCCSATVRSRVIQFLDGH